MSGGQSACQVAPQSAAESRAAVLRVNPALSPEGSGSEMAEGFDSDDTGTGDAQPAH